MEVLSRASEIIYEKIRYWLEIIIVMLPNAVIAILIIIVFNYLSGTLSRLLYKILNRLFDSNKTILRVLMTLFSYFIFLIGVFLALNILHWDRTVTTFLAGAGVVGLALSFAFQDLVTNFISGMFIAAQKPLSLGDLVETNGYMGHVTEIGMRSLTLKTLDAQHVTIPSKDVFQKPLKNYMQSPERRVHLKVGVSYSSDLEAVQRITAAAVATISEIDQRKGIHVFFSAFGDSSIDYDLYFWLTQSDQAHYVSVLSKVVIAIKKAYDKEGITIPFPIRTLDMSLSRQTDTRFDAI
ncbi:MAG: mechanosensitive ion channel family protein [Bernardetiaceae bacterium]